jgi:integrase
MGRKRKTVMSGLRLRNGIWHVEKTVRGNRLYESTGTGNQEEAERYLVHRLEQIRLAQIYGVRPKRIFREAATKYLNENHHKQTIADDACQIKFLDPYIGELYLEQIHMGSLQTYIQDRRKQGVKSRTINKALQVTRHILNLATSEWLDEYGLTWLVSAPRIKLLSEVDKALPYPLSWEEQDALFENLPPYLQRMALFKVNTGLRDQEVCKLRWEWECPILALNTSVFVIPGKNTKNKLDRLVVLNITAKQVIEEVRDVDPEYVFTYKGKPLSRMLNRAWLNARKEAKLGVRAHDLKHTFGRRLRAAGVSFEDRQDLLGHKSSRVTTHYSAAELKSLIDAANKVCRNASSTPILTIIRQAQNNVLSLVSGTIEARNQVNEHRSG